MANLDYGRIQDLEQLSEAYNEANSAAEREHYMGLMNRILSESDTIRSLRNDLIKAFRAKDTNRVKYIQNEIQQTRLNETRGHSWGNNKGNRKVT